jgi:hypothetical protein
MRDIVERLRAEDISGHGRYSALVRDAASEIERLRTALTVCVGVLAGEDLNKSALINALTLGNAALSRQHGKDAT